jgi:phage tail sheath protein FI
MPITPTYPGVYIEEVPSGVRTLVGVATSITAFIGRALRGPVNDPIRIQNFGGFERAFGGLWVQSSMSYAVRQYFQNGGSDAIIVRIVNGAATATVVLAEELPAPGTLTLEAASPGLWGNNLRATVDYATADPADTNLFNLIIKELDEDGNVVTTETFRNLVMDAEGSRFITKVLEEESTLVRVNPLPLPTAVRPTEITDEPFGVTPAVAGSDGNALGDTDYQGSQSAKTGIYALENADLFNILCIPPPIRSGDISVAVLDEAATYCEDRRAILIVDPPSAWTTVASVTNPATGVDGFGVTRNKNVALYFPRVRMADPLQENRLETFVPCGVVAGIWARTDAQRGVWKAPAGQEATMAGVRELSVKMTDGENGQLNPLGVNCLRTFPVVGRVVWGARTLDGADRLASEWKYLPVRRTALFIEESLYRGTQWVVFEPNDEPLWAQIRLNIGAFMQNLFRQGAFQGKTPAEAYLVKCDKETTTQNDINLGIVNILVGFAPLKPAEFVIIKIQQLAGQIET